MCASAKTAIKAITMRLKRRRRPPDLFAVVLLVVTLGGAASVAYQAWVHHGDFLSSAAVLALSGGR